MGVTQRYFLQVPNPILLLFSELFGELCKGFQLQALDHPIVLRNHHFDLIAFHHCNKFAKNNSNPFH